MHPATKRFILSVLACAMSLCLQAQEGGNARERAFLQDAGSGAAIFRGRQATRYNIVYEGTYFWDTPDFVNGKVMFDGQVFDGLALNIDGDGRQTLCESFQERI